jgi:hypothetical protein
LQCRDQLPVDFVEDGRAGVSQRGAPAQASMASMLQAPALEIADGG